jgi:signal transduction histidine kinase
MAVSISTGTEPNTLAPRAAQVGRSTFVFAAVVILFAILCSLFLRKGYLLAVLGDTLQLGLIGVTAILTFRNFLHSHSRIRVFWALTFAGLAIWTASTVIWAFYEVWQHQPVPDSPAGDTLLCVQIVPLTTAFAAVPHRERSSRFRSVGLLDVSVLMVYALYLYAFGVFCYRLIPGATQIYDLRFNIADAIGNLIFLAGAAFALLGSEGQWRILYRVYFFSVACYCLASNLCNVAIDSGRYYTGSLYDIPLIAALVGLLCFAWEGRTLRHDPPRLPVPSAPPSEELPHRAVFISSHLAMLVVLSTPVIGLWLLSGTTAEPLVRFRLIITLVTMFLLTLLLSVKEDLLNAGLISSLARLSDTYHRIDRFKSRLSESEKMAALGNLVAEVANQIKECMTSILEVATKFSSRPASEARVQGMAGKISQYAQRTDALVDNMLHFAQEKPIRPVPLQLKPLIESALQLSRIAKLPNLRVSVSQDGKCPPVRGDSGPLLHVFLELISNAVDTLEDVNGGSLDIKISHADSHAIIEFLDSGPGIKEPARVFEPFYTTKVVGKGTGLGLSTCYGIVQQHGGEITCRNRPLGGACFTIRLPLAADLFGEGSAERPVVMEGRS